VVILFIILAVWVIGVLAAVTLCMGARKLDAEISLERRLRGGLAGSDLVV
jgi:hypothetical protein